MKIINARLLFAGIILLALILRVWSLNNTPPSPDWDEVAYGYNSYSILKTGNDEYGQKLPAILKSFGDYKPALYSYLTIPSIAVFDLNPFSVRLPNALFGVIGVVALYYLVKLIFKREDVALLSAFFLAISPWSIQFSRFSHEGIVAVTLNILVVLFSLKGLKDYKLLCLSAFFSALSIYSYQSEKLFAPLLVALLFVVFIKDIVKVPKKYLILAVLVGLIVITPMVSFVMKDKAALGRAQGTSIFAHQTEILDKSAKQLIEDRRNNNIIGLIVHNRRFVYTQKIIENYLSHFDPNWLFVKGDLPRHHPPNMGIMYLFYFPLLLFGIYSLTIGKLFKLSVKEKVLIIGWLLLAIVPSSFTFDVPHAGRSMNAMPVPEIISAAGLIFVLASLRKRLSPVLYKSVLLFFIAIFLINFSYYLKQYFGNLNTLYSNEWQYGYKEAVSYINSQKGDYEHVIISDKVPMDQSYMFFLFFLKYPPEKYQVEQDKYHSFNGFKFRKIDWEKDSALENKLLVGSVKDFPKDVKILKKFNYLNGENFILVVN